MGTYVVSDLHGQYNLFCRLLEKIDFSEEDFLYVLGDAIDRGPDGIRILVRIMDTPNMDLIIGNHEFMMMNAVDPEGEIHDLPGASARLWFYSNGGDTTFEQYKTLPLEDRKRLLSYLAERKLSTLVMAGNRTYCLTHSNFNEDHIGDRFKDVDYDTIWNVVWMTPYRPDIYVPTSKYQSKSWHFIIGHVPVQRITGEYIVRTYNEGNISVIDGGMSFYGKGMLSGKECGIICLRLEDMEEIVVTADDDV